jgi:hypothetical protein
VLEKFEWPLSLHELFKKYEHKKNDQVFDRFNGYLVYFKYIVAIWSRIIEDLKVYEFLRNTRDKHIFPPGRTGAHKLTADEKHLMATTDAAQTLLEIDYESFLIFGNILMTRMIQVVASILFEDKKSQIPDRSFHEHKKHFLDYNEKFLQGGNIPRSIKIEYSKLIREKTEWYDLSLVLAWDKLVAHGNKYSIGVTTNTKGGIRINKENIFADFSREAKQLIAIKKKYEPKFSELKNVDDNLWEIMDFFMNYDIQLERLDKELFINIVHKTGGALPTLYFVARNISNFIEELAKIFGPLI